MIGRHALVRVVPRQWTRGSTACLPTGLSHQVRFLVSCSSPLLEKSQQKDSRFLHRGATSSPTGNVSAPFGSTASKNTEEGTRRPAAHASASFTPSSSSSASASAPQSSATSQAAGAAASTAAKAPSRTEAAQDDHDRINDAPANETSQPRQRATKGASAPTPPLPQTLENGIQRLFASWQQGLVASIGAVMGIGFLVYLLYTPVKEDTVHHTAVVASEALGDTRLKGKALQLSKDIVESVLQDEKSLLLVVELVRKLLAQEDTKVAISSLLQSLFEDHYTQEVTKKFVLMIVRDPWIMDQLQVIVKEQVLRLLQDESVKKALSKFLTESAAKSLEDPELQYETARAVRRSLIAVVNPWNGTA